MGLLPKYKIERMKREKRKAMHERARKIFNLYKDA